MDNLLAEQDAALLSCALTVLGEPREAPFMILITGLPGSGKSYLARCLAEILPAVILQSDALRKTLFNKPAYSAAESNRLFKAMRCLARGILGKGIPVIIDATNITERSRRYFYSIADTRGIKSVIVHTHAPEELVKNRLVIRRPIPDEMSDAGWEVYQRMLAKSEKIKRGHFEVDTSKNIAPAIAKIVQEVNNPAKMTSLRKGAKQWK